MKFPQGATDIEHGKQLLHERYDNYERVVLQEIDELARSGFADKRWCAIARTKIEEGVMALHKALRDKATDPDNYAKVPSADPHPTTFQPKVDPAGDRLVGPDTNRPMREIDWKDHNADGETGKG